MPIAKPLPGIRVFTCLFLLLALLAAPGAARAQSDEAIDKATKQNKKAVEEYENLNFEEARKILKDTLDFCAANGLDKHPIKARTHIHLGIVNLALKQRENAIKQFRKALEIQPDIKLTKSLANPEIQEAFDEATAGMAAGADKGEDKGGDKTPADKGEKAASDKGGDKAAGDKGEDKSADVIQHEPVTVATQGGAITITAKIDINLNAKKLILAYRPDGASDFLGRVMKEVTQGNWTAEIPATATAGNRVAYYIEAQAEDESTLGKKGTEDDPLIISLKGSGAPVDKGDADDDGDEDETPVHWFLGLGIGSGAGYVASATGEVNTDFNKINGGFAPATLGHLAPEIGYFVKPNVLISLQLRLQLITGPNDRQLDRNVAANKDQCGGDFVCTPAKYATAVLGKVAFLWGQEKFHPYFSVAAGGGQIRHVVTYSGAAHKLCGPTATSTDACVDTVLGGPVFVGPGVGFMYNVADNFALTLGLQTLAGFPDFTFNFDFNVGVAVEF
ncbi:MAG TPA: tetratricopeptide repeat protein [Polyangia bacterium]|nr:tetratricopeptide repeat protein [Polyangia bacterium]